MHLNALTLVVLAVIGYVFWQSGQTFLAALVLAVALIGALASSQPAQRQAPGHAGSPQVVVQGGSQIPANFQFRPNYPGQLDGDEWISTNLGNWLVLIGNFIGRLFSIGRFGRNEEEH
ncbi:MAG: hypothetical protein V1787_04205 [Candidatus Micrarchaeota archaeon]